MNRSSTYLRAILAITLCGVLWACQSTVPGPGPAASNTELSHTPEKPTTPVGKPPEPAGLRPLRTVGNKIVDSLSQTVRLRGVNCASMEWTSNGEGHILHTVQVAIDDWKCNIIRLPLTQDRWFGKASEQNGDAKPYRDLVDQIVKLCESKNCYIMLDLHWNDVGHWGQYIGQHCLPDENSVEFWKDFAPVYANRPAVIYDLYNEPHDTSWDIWLNGGQIMDRPNTQQGGPAQNYKAVGMQQMLDTVRATGSKNVVVCGGLDWSYDFSGILQGRRLKDPDGNGVIYANHAYINKGDSADRWIQKMEAATAVLPVIVSEFGGTSGAGGPGNGRAGRGGRAGGAGAPRAGGAAPGGGSGTSGGDDWLLHTMQAIEDHKWSYTAWDMHPSASPTLISNWNYTPTPNFGTFVKQMLSDQYPTYTPPALVRSTVNPAPLAPQLAP